VTVAVAVAVVGEALALPLMTLLLLSSSSSSSSLLLVLLLLMLWWLSYVTPAAVVGAASPAVMALVVQELSVEVAVVVVLAAVSAPQPAEGQAAAVVVAVWGLSQAVPTPAAQDLSHRLSPHVPMILPPLVISCCPGWRWHPQQNPVCRCTLACQCKMCLTTNL